MEYPIHVRRRCGNDLNALTQLEQRLQRERGRQQKKALEQQIGAKVKTLLENVRQDFPSPLARMLAITVLYQELGLVSETLANDLRGVWQQAVVREQDNDVFDDEIVTWNLRGLVGMCEKPDPNLIGLPIGSWFLQFDFVLAMPYISHDDEPLYLIDTPVSKDHVLGLPLIRPSSWKGNLRSALRLHKGWEKDDVLEMVRLFGNPKGTESDFRAGRLECFPTFFRRIGLEIINPHNRARKVGQRPILIECVPAGAKGTFSLLYVPFDAVGDAADDIRAQAKVDLTTTCEALSALMLTYGFSAKRTSGFGEAQDKIDGHVATRADKQPVSHLSKLVEEVANVKF